MITDRFIVKPRSSKQVPVPTELVNRVTAHDNAVTFTIDDVERLMGSGVDMRSNYKINHVTPLISVSPTMIAKCFDALRNGPPFSCLHRLDVELSKRGLQFSKRDGDLVPKGEMQTYIQNVMASLQIDGARALAATGVVAICFMHDPSTNMIIPYVPAPKTYTIMVGSIRGKRIYQLQWVTPDVHLAPFQRQRQPGRGDRSQDRFVASTSSTRATAGSPDSSAIILSGFGYDPDVDGKLNSPVAAFLWATDGHADLQKCTRTAEIILANPPMSRKTNNNEDAKQRAELVNSEYVGAGVVNPAGEGLNSRSDNQFVRNLQQRAVYNAQEKTIAAGLGAIDGTLLDEGIPETIIHKHRYDSPEATDAHGNAMPWANEIILPQGSEPATYTLPKPPSDFTTRLEYYDDCVFMAFLMPPSLIKANSRITVDAEVANKSFDDIATAWGKHLSKVLTFAHDSTYMWSDIKGAYNDLIRRKQKDKTQTSKTDELRLRVTPAEITDILNTVSSVAVSYVEIPSTTDVKELRRMYSAKEISWGIYLAAMAKRTGIDAELMAEKDELDPDLRTLIGCPEYAEILKLNAEKIKETNRHREVLQQRKADDKKRKSEDEQDEQAPVKKTK